MKKYIITIIMFFGLMFFAGNALAIDGVSLKLSSIGNNNYINEAMNEDVINMTSSVLSVSNDPFSNTVYLYVQDDLGSIVFFGKCKINPPTKNLPGSSDSISDDILLVVSNNECSVNWNNHNQLKEGKYQITSKIFFDTSFLTESDEKNEELVVERKGDIGDSLSVIIDRTAPTITLKGKTTQKINKGGTYNEEGATTDSDATILIEGSVDTSKVETQTIKYKAIDNAGNESETLTRTIEIMPLKEIDNKPVLSLSEIEKLYNGYINKNMKNVVLVASVKSEEPVKGTVSWELHSTKGIKTYPDVCAINSQGKKASDQESAALVDSDDQFVTSNSSCIFNLDKLSDGDYKIIATFDSATEGQADLKASTGVNIDRTAPVIELKGNAEMSITRGDKYEDEGVTVEGGILKETINKVITSTAGTYKVIYTAIDEAGNEATAERTVIVENPTRRSSSSGSYIGGLFGQSAVVAPVLGQVLGAESYFFTLLLKRGTSGPEVLELQKFLNLKGFDSGLADGKFGPITQASVIRFQLANGLVGDGIVGPLTRVVLNK
jgi:hypothetical protein